MTRKQFIMYRRECRNPKPASYQRGITLQRLFGRSFWRLHQIGEPLVFSNKLTGRAYYLNSAAACRRDGDFARARQTLEWLASPDGRQEMCP